MKTINVASKSDLKVFTDSEGKHVGFAGTVLLYDSAIYIDTRDGTGYEETITKLTPLIYKFLSKFYFGGNSYEDTKQDIILHILEGIPKYDPRKDVKLSTFIEMRVHRRLINELRDKSRIFRNATFLNVSSYHFTCKCGNNFVLTISNDESEVLCNSCGKRIKIKKKVSVNTPEVNESMLFHIDEDRGHDSVIDELPLTDYNLIRSSQKPVDEQVITREDMNILLENEDPKIAEMVRLIYFYDYSIKAAAEKVGISSAGANIKLKKLQDNKMVRELFNR